MPTTYTRLLYHVVFSTKHRQPLVAEAWRSDLHAYIGGMVRNRKGDRLAAGGMPDHQHLLVRAPADWAVSDLVRDIKAVTSKWRHDGGDLAFGWQTGYGAFTVSVSMVDTVAAYIDRQPYHHRRRTFQDELVGLLRKHGIEYDERHLWD